MLEGEKTTLTALLEAREARSHNQKRLIGAHRLPLISFTLNIAGPVKSGPLIDSAFDEGLGRIKSRFEPNIAEIEERRGATGSEALIALKGEALDIKRTALGIEQADALGRLFDIDVLTAQGHHISRADAGLPERRCLICAGPAHACARSRRHALDEVEAQTQRILEDYFSARCADRAAGLATRALMTEACVAPKPGLVDRLGNGAHRDMDIFTFIDSASSLTPFFRAAALKGWSDIDLAPDELFEELREIGLRAQEAMYRATNGINAHKGAIYALSLVCAALGRLDRTARPATPLAVAALCGDMARPSAERAFACITPENSQTTGEALYAAYGLRGARGEAADGFPAVIHHALPALQSALFAGLTLNDSALIALAHLIIHAQDTVLIARAGLGQYASITKEIAAQLRASPHPDAAYFKALDESFTKRNLSPGGSADLLSVTLMFNWLSR